MENLLVKITVGLAMAACAFVGISAHADEYVEGHFTRTGHYVAPYYKTSPNSFKSDNYSTYGNTNPYNEKRGSARPNNEFGSGYGYDNQGT